LAVEFAVDIYKATEVLPKSELYGLTGQLRRASVSIAANIAEGSGRRSTPDLLHFLSIAKGSLREVDTLLEIVGRLDFGLPVEPLRTQGESIARQLSALSRSLKSRSDSSVSH
jgi:four helix bundle protein